jgi:NADP-dependent 3-hydroxy acid dehydrogenase YdfG
MNQFNTNFYGVIKAAQAVLPHFRANKSGTMITIGSIAGINGQAGSAAVSYATPT